MHSRRTQILLAAGTLIATLLLQSYTAAYEDFYSDLRILELRELKSQVADTH